MQEWVSSRWLPPDCAAGRDGEWLGFVSPLHESEFWPLILILFREMGLIKPW